ncbi:MAG: short-chain dehydrogenase/reductase [Acidimicrobiaceae bacterium]|nr:short-chain dehydrogenase/reductase [Acidimicrobiaceae bacterium]
MSPPPDHGEKSYRGSERLVDRRAVVTGGDSGIGRAVALAFAREGADVLITHLEDEAEDAAETAALVQEAGRRCVMMATDLTEQANCVAVIERAVAELGGLDLLVNNAAYQMAQPGGLADITDEQLDRVFKTNLYALFWTCRAALPHLGPGSAIVNTASIEAYSPAPPLLDYAATKGAIVNFTKGLAQHLAERGVRVNAVAPGPIWTPLIPATMPEDEVSQFGKNTPLGRAGQPAELAPAYVFLASGESSYITGEVIGVTGGKLLP